MARLKNGLTPKEQALAIAITLIAQALSERDEAFSEWGDMTPKQQLSVRDQLAKLHNRLLNQSGLDGIERNAQGEVPL
jgi:hypothetical protein